MIPEGRGEAIEQRLRRFEELQQLLSDPKVLSDRNQIRILAKEHAQLKPLVDLVQVFQQVKAQLESTREILESKESQGEIRELALHEVATLKARERELQEKLDRFLVFEDPEDDKNVIVEIRPGTGGAEAGLFAGDLYRMYTRYAAQNSWQIESLSASPTELGGFKEVIFGVEGTDVFRRLKFERGVHRVQRVPETEASGRIHTSTVTVAILPQAEEVEVQIDSKDLRVDVFRSSGPGGQSVNTADSAVRITYLPTNLVVICQDERSQLKNKAKAMKVLRARLLEEKTQAQSDERALERRSQIGSGERSEKIRTYNFPDRRITDHRVGITTHRLEEVLNGDLNELIEPLLEAERNKQLGIRKAS